MTTDDLVKIHPTELKFPFKLKKQSSCSILLTNKTTQYVAFKVLTTNPRMYCVRPNSGVVLPGDYCNVTVVMQAQEEAPMDMQCKDKFLIQTVIVSDGTTSKEVHVEMFNKEAGRVIKELKLRVVYIPANPPSPVPERSDPVQQGPPHTVSASPSLLFNMSEPIKNIVLVGRTGNGKSATGNTLLGQQMFNSELQAEGVTMECKMYTAAIQDGPIINVIDTPGLFDLSVPADYISREIIKCITMATGGIHALLYVLSVGNRITKEEESTLDTLQVIFESKILDYVIVVFTGGDRLEANNQTLDDYFRAGYPEFLRRALRLCGGRMVLFNNMTNDKVKKAEQVKELLDHVVAIEKNNGGKPYTDKMHRDIKEGEKFREQQRKAESEKLAAEMAVMKENLVLENDEKMRRMAQLLERRIQKNAEAYEIMMQQMRNY